MFNAGITDPAERTEFPGVMSGNVKLAATAGDKPNIRAAGELHITNARIGKLPVMMGLLHVIYLTLPGETEQFHGGGVFRNAPAGKIDSLAMIAHCFSRQCQTERFSISGG